MSGHAGKPVGPGVCRQILELCQEIGVIEKEALNSAVKDHDLELFVVSIAVMISLNCSTNSGPMRLSGGLSKVIASRRG